LAENIDSMVIEIENNIMNIEIESNELKLKIFLNIKYKEMII